MGRVVLNHTTPNIDETVFPNGDWTDFYRDIVKEDPPNMPVPLGNSVVMSCFIDADHAGNKVTRRSHTGIFILLNNAPITAFGKRQNTLVKNVSFPESTLAKKHNAINYHIIWEAVAAKILRVGKEDTLANIADVFTKLVPYTRKRELLAPFLWDR